MEYIFLAGIHAVGKTTLLKKVSKDISIVHESVSDLIRMSGKKIVSSDKFTDGINENQGLWKERLKNLEVPQDKWLILDGHFTLINKSRNIEELPYSTFENTDVKKIILKKEAPKKIQERLKKRDRAAWDLDKIVTFQKAEEKRAKEFSIQKGIPLFIYDDDELYQSLLEFIRN